MKNKNLYKNNYMYSIILEFDFFIKKRKKRKCDLFGVIK